MAASSLSYIVVEARDPEQWRKFGVDTLGLAPGPVVSEGGLTLRVDERPFRIAVQKGSRDRFVVAGWEFARREAFDACIASLKAAGHTVTSASTQDAQARFVNQLARSSDPAGNSFEFFYGRTLDYAPFASPRGVSGFVTGRMGMGHVVLPAPALEECRAFYEKHLGLGLTDEMWLDMTGNPSDPRLGLYFMHADNPRHHSLALMGAPAPSGCVHFMLEARTLDDVGYALDRCMRDGVHISSSFGRHSNDFMVSFYALTPGGFDIEFGCQGLQVEDWSRWVPTHSLIGDLWGHRWAPPPAGE